MDFFGVHFGSVKGTPCDFDDPFVPRVNTFIESWTFWEGCRAASDEWMPDNQLILGGAIGLPLDPLARLLEI